jgi:hypothetical protein
LVAVALLLAPALAFAHVKWFVNYDLLTPPRPAMSVLLSRYFLLFSLFIAPLIFVIAFVDDYLARRRSPLVPRVQTIEARVSRLFPLLLRFGTSAFFFAVFGYGCLHEWMILTPELRTHSAWICVVQLAIAVCALSRRTAFIAGIGIVFLFAFGVRQYGLFHMLDYPIFLGVAIFLIAHSTGSRQGQELALDAVRIATAVTLLWASVEKWAFPEWSFMLMAERPGLTLGFDPEFYMIAAGFVEFCAAFLLLTGSLAARVAALVLLLMFLSAIVPFGVIDAIGHSVIIVVLILLIFSDNKAAKYFSVDGSGIRTAALQTSYFVGALLLFFFAYYVGYHLSYGHA